MNQGHATPKEHQQLERLEANLDLEGTPGSEIIELVSLYIEPFHREDHAIQLLERLLRRDPKNSLARIWLGYLCIHHLIDPAALLRAADLMTGIIEDDSEHTAAAYWLLAVVAKFLQHFGERLSIGPVVKERLGVEEPTEVDLLRASVRLAPGWVYNHADLARHFARTRTWTDALREIEIALENIIPFQPTWNAATQNFEMFISGRWPGPLNEETLKSLQHEILQRIGH